MTWTDEFTKIQHDHERQLLAESVERSGPEFREWTWTCPICGEKETGCTSAMTAHRSLRKHFATCRPVGL
jgi:phage terminase large subunit GpA-like protein